MCVGLRTRLLQTLVRTFTRLERWAWDRIPKMIFPLPATRSSGTLAVPSADADSRNKSPGDHSSEYTMEACPWSS